MIIEISINWIGSEQANKSGDSSCENWNRYFRYLIQLECRRRRRRRWVGIVIFFKIEIGEI